MTLLGGAGPRGRSPMKPKTVFVVKVFGPSKVFRPSDVIFKEFECKLDALKWATGSAFAEFNNEASRVELYEISAEAVDSIEEVKAGRAKLLGVQDPVIEMSERLRKLKRHEYPL
jgi:hypothetical protein